MMIFISQILEDLTGKVKSLQDRFPNLSPKDSEKLIYTIADSDPTPNKMYLGWLVTQVIKKIIILPDDNERVIPVLTWFDKIKNTRDWQAFKDINKFTFHTLEDLYDKQHGESYKTHLELKKEHLITGAKLWYTDSTWRVYEVLTREGALILGQSSKWCWSSKDNAQYTQTYLKWPPLLVLIKDGSQYAAVSFYSKEMMDVRDRAIKPVPKDMQNALIKFADVYPDKDKIMNLPAMIKGRVPPLEPYIINNVKIMFWYIKNIIKGRWPDAESIIVKDPNNAFLYAEDIIKGPWPAGEPAIAKDAVTAYWYARNVIEGPWPKGEPAIAKDALYSYHYAADILHGRFAAGEQAITKDSVTYGMYEKNVLKTK